MRWKEVQRRRKIKLVQPAAATATAMSSTGPLPLTVSKEGAQSSTQTSDMLDRQVSATVLPDTDACGDIGPVLREAVNLALACLTGSMEITAIQAEASPVACSSSIRLCVQPDPLHTGVTVTGWCRDEPVLRLQVLVQPRQ